ncbi:MAG: hypothetical protein ACXABO_02800 [Promethearchaeota archaeon]|jgi:chromosome segregation ATPase
MSEEELKKRIRELESELGIRENEIEQLEDTIEELENTIMKIEEFTPEESTKKSKKMQAAESKFAYYLEEKDKDIRELKNNMGYLRKEKVQLQQEYDKLQIEYTNLQKSSIIRVEDIRTKSPLNALVAELQDTVNKQRSTINKLIYENKEFAKFNEELKEKEDVIEAYKSEITELNRKLKDLSSTSGSESEDSITTKLIEDLQSQLNKSKRQIIDLKQKLSKSDKKSKKSDKKADTKEIKKLENQLTELNQLLSTKTDEVENLKSEISSIRINEPSSNLGLSNATSSKMTKKLREDLQNKLNKSKLLVKSLQEELNKYKTGEISSTGESQKEIEGKLKMQREMAAFLQKQLETKEGELETIKNEAVQIKKRYRQLENQLKVRDQKLNDLQKQVENQSIQISPQTQEDPHHSLRLRELKNLIEDLKKQNIEQRLEIAQLRKQ